MHRLLSSNSHIRQTPLRRSDREKKPPARDLSDVERGSLVSDKKRKQSTGTKAAGKTRITAKAAAEAESEDEGAEEEDDQLEGDVEMPGVEEAADEDEVFIFDVPPERSHDKKFIQEELYAFLDWVPSGSNSEKPVKVSRHCCHA